MSVNQILHSLPELFVSHCQNLARPSGFCQRRSRLSASAWVQGLVFGWLANPKASVASLASAMAVAGAPISPQAVQQRFGEAGAQLLRSVLDTLACQTLTKATRQELSGSQTRWLHNFPAIWLRDSSLITLPMALYSQWPGSGGQHGKSAALKMNVVWEWHSGTFLPLHLTPGTTHDQKAALEQEKRALQQGHKPLPGEMHVFDLGYFSLKWLAQLQAQGSYFCCRYKGATRVQPVECPDEWTSLVAWLQRLPATTERGEWQMRVGRTAQLPVRVIAVRVPEEVAVRRRQSCLYYNGRRQRTVSQERLALCSWNVYVTNAPQSVLNASQVGVLYRLRWQIERLFRLWKETLSVDTWRTQNPQRILCEVYAKLIGALLTQQLSVFCAWHCPHRSLVKCAHIIAAHALAVLIHLSDERALRSTLRALRRAMHPATLESRSTKPATFQRIMAV